MKFIISSLFFFGNVLFVHSAGWNYSDIDAWKTESGTFCNGMKQSPINFPPMIEMTYRSQLVPFTFTGYDVEITGGKIKNNGHSVVVTFDNDATVRDGDLGATFKAVQFHFHWGRDDTVGSEHTYNGKTYPMELHIVHYNKKYADLSEAVKYPDGLAVLGFFIEVGPIHNCNFAPIIDKLANIKGKDNEVVISGFKLRHLMPMDIRDYYRYQGSLTTPTCNEAVKWTVFRNRLYMSTEQIAKFREVFYDTAKTQPMVDNWRPPQPIGQRKIYISFSIQDTSSAPFKAILCPALLIIMLIHLL